MRDMRVQLFFGLAVVVLTLGACSTFTPADPVRSKKEVASTPISWPARDLAVLGRYASQTPDAVFELEPMSESDNSSFSGRESFLLNEPHLRLVHNAVYANVLLRLWEDRRSFTDATKWQRESSSVESALGFIPNGSLITSRGLTNGRSVVSLKLRRQALDFEMRFAPKTGSRLG